MKLKIKGKLGQEEMVGFALIVVIVAVILLVFISFSLKSPEQEPIKSYEIDNFLQSLLSYTIEYESEYIEIQDLIKECNKYDEGCDLMESELKNILNEVWIVEEGSVIKGYDFEISSKDKEIFVDAKGEATLNYKIPSLFYEFSDIEIMFKVYY